MTAKDWISFSRQLPPYARVTFTGGEPLVFNGFDEVFHEVATKFECNMICNGLRLTEKKSNFTEKKRDFTRKHAISSSRFCVARRVSTKNRYFKRNNAISRE